MFISMLTNAPIYAFDIIAVKKIYVFHDFSPLLQKDHPLTMFIEEKQVFKPSKERELPEKKLSFQV